MEIQWNQRNLFLQWEEPHLHLSLLVIIALIPKKKKFQTFYSFFSKHHAGSFVQNQRLWTCSYDRINVAIVLSHRLYFRKLHQHWNFWKFIHKNLQGSWPCINSLFSRKFHWKRSPTLYIDLHCIVIKLFVSVLGENWSWFWRFKSKCEKVFESFSNCV